MMTACINTKAADDTGFKNKPGPQRLWRFSVYVNAYLY